MEPASIAIALMLATAPPAASNAQNREPPIRCRPAPYYVSERTGKQIPRVLLDTPKGQSIAVLDKRGRPCHLTRTPSEGRTTFRVAD